MNFLVDTYPCRLPMPHCVHPCALPLLSVWLISMGLMQVSDVLLPFVDNVLTMKTAFGLN